MTPNTHDQPFDRSLGDLEPYAPPERLQAAWVVTVGSIKLTMLGEKCRKAEALANARVIWPGSKVS